MTQKDIHIKNLTELVEMLEAEGLRDKVILACGGPRISHELAKELGYDAGLRHEHLRRRRGVVHRPGDGPQNAPQIGNGPGFQNRPVSRQYDEQTKTT